MKFADKSAFINEAKTSWVLRLVILFSGVGIWLLALLVSPQVRRIFAPFREDLSPGVYTFLGHLVFNSFPLAVLCVLALLVMHRFDIVRFPKVTENLRFAVKEGIIVGLALVALIVVIAMTMGFSFQFKIGAWKMAGDLFSNAYEEIVFRGFILLTALFCFRSYFAAIVVSSLVFGWSHGQYPLVFQIFTGTVGAVMAVVYLRTANLVAPWIVHQIGDVILDTILVLPS